MIVHKPKKRTADNSSFKKLAMYISRENTIKNGHGLKINNCQTNDIGFACTEISDTQAMNTRTKKDKTYHLVVSFPEGEIPTPDQLDDIENELCKSIGYEDHQRISAVHEDTDNFHFHIAINRIHPETFNITNVRYDFNKLNECAAELEQKHGLTQVCSAEEKKPKTQTPDNLRSQTGQQTFKDFITENTEQITSIIDKSTNWKQCQEQLSAELGISIKPRGRGMVLATGTGKQATHTKLSDLGRGYTAPKLTKRFGEIQVYSDPHATPKRQYIAAPVEKASEKSELWSEFQKRQNAKRVALSTVKAERKNVMDSITAENRLKRSRIKSDTLLSSPYKFQAYKLLAANTKTVKAEAAQQFKQKRQAVFDQFPEKNWQDFLVKQAEAGNTQALALLRTGKKNQYLANKLAVTSDQIKAEKSLFEALKPKIQRSGNVVYTIGKSKITDTGTEFNITRADNSGISAMLRMARERHGDVLTIKGDDAFKQSVVEVAVAEGMKIKFADETLERKRQVLEAAITDPYKKRQQIPEPPTPEKKNQGYER